MGSVGKSTTTNNTSVLNNDGELNSDGSVTMKYLHISQSTQNYGSQFGQDIEPKGEYMSFISPTNTNQIELPNYTYGTIRFNKPLVLEWKSTGPNGWKKDLSEMFGGKTGKALSNAVKKAGYDGIMTYDVYKGQRMWSEIVNLSGTKL